MTFVPHRSGEPEFFHVGIVVPDVIQAIAQYGAALGIRFVEPRLVPLNVSVDGEPKAVQLRQSFNTDGPVYLELIEEHAGSTWASDALGMHHIGFWSSDVDAAAARLEASGMPARVRVVPQAPLATYHESPSGIWVELVSAAGRETFDAWLSEAGRTLG